MKYLLDTHVLLWLLTDSRHLSQRARNLLSTEGNEFFFSAASIWEIAIKHRKRPGDIPCSGREAKMFAEESGLKGLPILPAHVLEVEDLPSIHGDPFDRLLVSQARSESMILLSHDHAVLEYGHGVEEV